MARTRTPVIWLVEDDEYFAKKYAACMKGFARTIRFEAPYDAYEASAASPDVIMVDLSAVDPIGPIGGFHGAYSAIGKLGQLHPGATILIVSAVSHLTSEDIAEEVREVAPNVVEVFGWVGGSEQFQSVADRVKELV